ncbi:hypothetical protein B0H16DRAFT_1377269 [Mycena metata]|uniref:DUF7779 domain-containing protein n=1 Tax=Mycena metata TaxID=1033252 RepID=A0AAD7IJ23_9AGAR|nr:hypothetical protein B0H16DRAFT_1377269 [Mycena metata]
MSDRDLYSPLLLATGNGPPLSYSQPSDDHPPESLTGQDTSSPDAALETQDIASTKIPLVRDSKPPQTEELGVELTFDLHSGQKDFTGGDIDPDTNLSPTVPTEKALRLYNIPASQIANHCPPPSRIFCGRRDILDKMHHFFSDTGIQHTYVLHGLGGAGKTQIALQLINESSSRFSDIFFINASTIATIQTGLRNIAVLENCGDSPQDGLQWLTSKVEEWLLLFDSADDPSINLHEFIPQCNHGNIIITSRNPGLHVYAGSHSLVSNMEGEDAVALLLKSALQEATSHTEQVAAEIVKTLHYLPLAIVQAGAFISRSQNLDGYLALYMENQERLLSEKPALSPDQYAWTVYTTWQRSFDGLTPPAAIFLQHCAFLHYDGISEKIFRYASKYPFPSGGPSRDELQGPLEFLSHFLGPTGEWDSSQFLDVTNEVQAYSLISFNAERKLFSIHPLVQAWTQATVQNPKRYMSTVGSILGMAISAHPQWDMQLTSLLWCPHVELAIQIDAEVALYFRHQYARTLSQGGRYKQALKLQEEVLEKQKQVLGQDHPDTLHTMGYLAGLYSSLGEHVKAHGIQVLVLEKQKQILGENHPDTLRTMSNLANLYSALGEFQIAKELEGIVVEKQKQVLGDNHPDTLRTIANLAISYSNLGEHHRAQDLRVLVLEKQKQILGENHPATLHMMGNLASSYSDLGEYQIAKELLSVVLEKQKQILGVDHPDTLHTMGNLASSYSCMGEHKKANELQVIVVEKQKQLLGENHPHTLHTIGNLAGSYLNLGEHRRAKDLTLVVLEKQKQVLGENHPDTLHTLGNLAGSYSKLGDNQEAQELQGIVLEKQKQILGDDHPDTLHTMGNLASSYSCMGDHKKANELQVIVVEKQKQLLGDNHPATLLSMGNLATSYLDMGEDQKGKELLGIVVEKQKQLLGDNHPHTLRTMTLYNNRK